MDWIVYILQCSDTSLYTGITTNLEKRVATHNSSRGAKYLRGKLPVAVVYRESHPTRSSALRREAQIKSLSRQGKLDLIK